MNGRYNECITTPCYLHENWFSQEQNKQIATLQEIVDRTTAERDALVQYIYAKDGALVEVDADGNIVLVGMVDRVAQAALGGQE
jgi:hypothetical protein